MLSLQAHFTNKTRHIILFIFTPIYILRLSLNSHNFLFIVLQKRKMPTLITMYCSSTLPSFTLRAYFTFFHSFTKTIQTPFIEPTLTFRTNISFIITRFAHFQIYTPIIRAYSTLPTPNPRSHFYCPFSHFMQTFHTLPPTHTKTGTGHPHRLQFHTYANIGKNVFFMLFL